MATLETSTRKNIHATVSQETREEEDRSKKKASSSSTPQKKKLTLECHDTLASTFTLNDLHVPPGVPSYLSSLPLLMSLTATYTLLFTSATNLDVYSVIRDCISNLEKPSKLRAAEITKKVLESSHEKRKKEGKTNAITTSSLEVAVHSRIFSALLLGSLVSRVEILGRIGGLSEDVIVALCKVCRQLKDEPIELRNECGRSVAAIFSGLQIFRNGTRKFHVPIKTPNDNNRCYHISPGNPSSFVVDGCSEATATTVIKTLKKMQTDANTNLRYVAGCIAASFAPFAALAKEHSRDKKALAKPYSFLDDLIGITLDYLDDVGGSGKNATQWGKALSSCVVSAVGIGRRVEREEMVKGAKREEAEADSDSHDGAGNKKKFNQFNQFKSSKKSNEDDGENTSDPGAHSNSHTPSNKSSGVKINLPKFSVGSSSSTNAPPHHTQYQNLTPCLSLHTSIRFLGGSFLKAGGETGVGSSSPFSPSYSSLSGGGRAFRGSVAIAVGHLLAELAANQTITKSGSTMKQIIGSVLDWVGNDFYNFTKQANSSSHMTGGGGLGSPVKQPHSSSTSTISGNFNISNSNTETSDVSNSNNQHLTDLTMGKIAVGITLRSLGQAVNESLQQRYLSELIDILTTGTAKEGITSANLNQSQLQVVLTEISHLIPSLSEASKSYLEALLPALHECFEHPEHGVRFEAATCLASVCSVFPMTHIQPLLTEALQRIEENHNIIGDFAATQSDATKEVHSAMCKLHAYTSFTAMMFHSKASKWLVTKDQYRHVFAIAESLANRQWDEQMSSVSVSLVCTCVKAAYTLLSALLTFGPAKSSRYVGKLFRIWQNCIEAAKSGTNPPTMDASHELVVLDAVTASILIFLRCCPSLLLSIPDALTRSCLLLENLLGIVSDGGRLANPPTISGAARLDLIKASLLEAFSWLPPGSFPLSADQLFAWACDHIKTGGEANVTTSLLPTLLSEEDDCLDSNSENSNLLTMQIFLSSSAIDHSEREAMLHVNGDTVSEGGGDGGECEDGGGGSLGVTTMQINASALITPLKSAPLTPNTRRWSEEKIQPPPTPLHAAGNWKKPQSPFGSAPTRLLDASIHIFACLFGLQDGLAQAKAINTLASLLPKELQVGNSQKVSLGLGNLQQTFMSESERQEIKKNSLRRVMLVVTSLLECLQALPDHQGGFAASQDWVKKTREILLTTLSASDTQTRRGAAYGLGLLCSRIRGNNLTAETVTNLEYICAGKSSSGKARKGGWEAIVAGKCGALLGLASIGRYSGDGGGGVGGGSGSSNSNVQTLLDAALKCVGVDSVGVGGEGGAVCCWALHAVGILADKMDFGTDNQSIRKHLTLLQDVVDRLEVFMFGVDGDLQEGFGVSSMKLMNTLLPLFFEIDPTHPCIGRLAMFAQSAYTRHKNGGHPQVTTLYLTFVEMLCLFDSKKIDVPSQLSNILFEILPVENCAKILRKGIGCVKGLARVATDEVLTSVSLHAHLLSLLEKTITKQCYGKRFRGVAFARDMEIKTTNNNATVENEIQSALEALMNIDGRNLHWLLFARFVMTSHNSDGSDSSNNATAPDDDDGEDTPSISSIIKSAQCLARYDAFIVKSSRWQIKLLATQIAIIILQRIDTSLPTNFDIKEAHIYLQNALANNHTPSSYVALHFEELVSAACSTSTASSAGEELDTLQTSGLAMLRIVIDRFVDAKDPDSIDDDQYVISNLLSQITAAIRPSLQRNTRNKNELLENACRALLSIAPRLSPGGLKRLLKPLQPTSKALCEDNFEKFQATVLKIATISQIFVDQGHVSARSLVDSDLTYEYCAICAFDAVKCLKWFEQSQPPMKLILWAGGGLGKGRKLDNKMLSKNIYNFAYAAANCSEVLSKEYTVGVFHILLIGLRKALEGGGGEKNDAWLYICLKGIILILKESFKKLTNDTTKGDPINSEGNVDDSDKDELVNAINQAGEKLIHAVYERESDGIFFSRVADFLTHDSLAGLLTICETNLLYLSKQSAVHGAWDSFFSFVGLMNDDGTKIECARAAWESNDGFPVHRLEVDVGVVMNLLGAKIIAKFRECVKETDTKQCAGLMRVLLQGYRELVDSGKEEGEEDGVGILLGILLPLFVEAIEKHGLPNGYLAGVGFGDPQIGKMASQALLHFMKTSQNEFKSAMVNIGEQKRVIETAVRGEMSNYSGGGVGGTTENKPKKLSLSNLSAYGK